MNLFLFLIASHLCGDGLCNPTFIARAKRSDKLLAKVQATALHSLIHACFVWLWLWSFEWQLKLWASFYIFAVHFVIDFLRTHIDSKNDLKIIKKKDALLYLLGLGDVETKVFLKKHGRRWTLINMADQGLHLLAIVIFVVMAAN